MPTVRGIANWARVHTPDKYDNYSILVDVPDDFPKLLKAEKVKSQCSAIDREKKEETHDPKAMFAFNFKKAKFLRSGAEVPGPSVVDANTAPIPPSTLIGNGSEVIVQYHTYPYGNEGQHRMVLDAVQVVNLVKFEGTAREAAPLEFAKVEGYTADESGDI
jgi:hypothetical protein